MAGAAHAATGLLVGALAGRAVRSTAVATYTAVAQRELGRAARDVERALMAGQVERARSLLPALVGRDPAALDPAGMARAAVESVAENSVDAVVAPVLWAVAGGPSGVLAYRAANTLDAMVGHKSERYLRFGWASARIDDAANYLPARVAAGLVALVRPRRAGPVWRAVTEQAGQHPSPNAGVVEAAFAAALDLRLGGTNRYGERVEERPVLGTGRPPGPEDIGRAVTLSRHVTAALSGLLIGAAVSRRA